MQTYNCPNCLTPFALGDFPKIGELVQCQHCEMTFEVVWLFPLDMIPINVQVTPMVEKLPDQM